MWQWKYIFFTVYAGLWKVGWQQQTLFIYYFLIHFKSLWQKIELQNRNEIVNCYWTVVTMTNNDFYYVYWSVETCDLQKNNVLLFITKLFNHFILNCWFKNLVKIKVETKLLVVFGLWLWKNYIFIISICLFVETFLTTIEILIFITFSTTLNIIAHEKYSLKRRRNDIFWIVTMI